MSQLPISSPYRDRPDDPVTDDERERLTARLNAAFAAGAFDADEYNWRLDVLWSADRLGQLVPVVNGLPPRPTHEQPAIVAQRGGRPGELSPTRDASTLAVAGGAAIVLAVVLLVVLLILVL